MKKIYYLILMSLICSNSFATMHMVAVSNFAFTPASLNVTVGDTIMWSFVSGSHTTTSLSVPAGAATWDELINSGNTSFEYVITEEGTYTYDCTFHPSMQGTIVATNSTVSIPTVSPFVNSITSSGKKITVNYNLKQSANFSMTIFDVTGKAVRKATNSLTAGNYTEVYFVEELNSGIYIVELTTETERTSKRVIIQ